MRSAGHEADLLEIADRLVSDEIRWVLPWGELFAGRQALQGYFARVSRRTLPISHLVQAQFIEPDGFAHDAVSRRRVVVPTPGVPVGAVLEAACLWRFTVGAGLIIRGEQYLQSLRVWRGEDGPLHSEDFGAEAAARLGRAFGAPG